ncbi:MAG: hypothetical protein JRI25_16105 [Deltaproteobacteria bacterium]|nr:hypothetical protein [Deltaproteobacteria bacterium]
MSVPAMRAPLWAISATIPLFLCTLPCPISAHNGAVAIAVPVEGIVVDGDLGDWPATVEWHPIDNWHHGGPVWGPTDLAARVAFAHDAARRELLVAVDMRDDQPDSVKSRLPEGAFLSVRRHLDDEVREDLNPDLRFDGTPVRTEATSREAIVAARRTDDGYRYEWRIDVGAEIDKALSGIAPVVAVAVTVTDREGPGLTGLSWGLIGQDGDVILTAPQAVGTLHLRVESAATEEGVSGVDLSLRSPGGRDRGVTARTGADGQVDLQLPAGTYQVEAAPVWTSAVGADVTVRAGAAAALKLALPAPRTSVRAAGRGRGVWQGLSVPDGLAGLSVYDVLQDRRGDLWLAAEGGLSRYDGTKVTTYTVADGLPNHWVNTVHEDRHGVIWVGTGALWVDTPSGVARFDAGGVLPLPEPLAGIHDNITAIAEDRAGRVWLAGPRLLRWDGDRLVDLTGSLDPAPDMLVSALIDRQGRAWVAGWVPGSGGLWCVEADSTRDYHATSKPVWSMAEDPQGGLWVGTGPWGGRTRRVRYCVCAGTPSKSCPAPGA